VKHTDEENTQLDMFPKAYDIEGNELKGSHKKVYDVMSNGKWITIETLADRTGMTGSGASACMRNLRMEKFGSFIVERQHVKGTLYKYRLVL
jgi:ribosomal protein S25